MSARIAWGDRPISSLDDGGDSASSEKYLSPQRRRQRKQLRSARRCAFTCTSLTNPLCSTWEGTQDLKWLATVAAQRFDRMARPNGRMRQRETIRAGAGKCRVVLPAEVRTPRSSPRPGLNEAEWLATTLCTQRRASGTCCATVTTSRSLST